MRVKECSIRTHANEVENRYVRRPYGENQRMENKRGDAIHQIDVSSENLLCRMRDLSWTTLLRTSNFDGNIKYCFP